MLRLVLTEEETKLLLACLLNCSSYEDEEIKLYRNIKEQTGVEL